MLEPVLYPDFEPGFDGELVAEPGFEEGPVPEDKAPDTADDPGWDNFEVPE